VRHQLPAKAFFRNLLGVTPPPNPSYNFYGFLMRLQGSISDMCWVEGRACPRRYLSVLPSNVRANLFGSD
jgi:hypothetical protein